MAVDDCARSFWLNASDKIDGTRTDYRSDIE
jgi:hypothetical protein